MRMQFALPLQHVQHWLTVFLVSNFLKAEIKVMKSLPQRLIYFVLILISYSIKIYLKDNPVLHQLISPFT